MFQNLYGKLTLEKPEKPKFTLGDLVRISKAKLTFEKRSATQNYAKEIFRISKVIQAVPNYYFIQSLAGERIDGKLYF